MSVSYSLHLVTEQSVDAVLSGLFEIPKVESVPNSTVQFVRGVVFLAHGKSTDEKATNRFTEDFGIAATISILFFPDGVSDHETALDLLAIATARWINLTSDDLILVANNKTLVFKRAKTEVTRIDNSPFWTQKRKEILSKI